MITPQWAETAEKYKHQSVPESVKLWVNWNALTRWAALLFRDTVSGVAHDSPYVLGIAPPDGGAHTGCIRVDVCTTLPCNDRC